MTVDRIAEHARKYTEYDLIREHTELPQFPELRARLLFSFLRHSSLPLTLSELITLVTSLAQMGFDTHDMVSETNDSKEQAETRSRQLKVLAGDYFSSRFYYLLSQAGQIELTKHLAQAICEVNRMKVSFYTRMKQLKLTAEEYLQQTVSINARLFLGFGRMMEGARCRLWPEVLESLTRCEVLLAELKRSEDVGRMRGGWAFWHILQIGSKEDKKQIQQDQLDAGRLKAILHKYHVTGHLWQLLEQQARQLAYALDQLDMPLTRDLRPALDPVFRLLKAPKALEEM